MKRMRRTLGYAYLIAGPVLATVVLIGTAVVTGRGT